MSVRTRRAVNTARQEEYAAMTDLRTELSALRVEVSKLAVSIATLSNRQDISGELDKRVDRATYEVAHRAMEADIRDLASDLEEFKRRSAGTMPVSYTHLTLP